MSIHFNTIYSRVSHLVDIAHLELTEAETLLSKLRKHPSCRSLRLLQFKDRFTFLCNIHRLEQHLKSTIHHPSQFIFIAVEGKEPLRLNQPPIHLIDWLKNKLLESRLIKDDSKRVTYYSPIVPPFMVALTGWALEYPIIYTTHLETDDPEIELDEWEPRSNCLGNQRTLNLIQVYLKDHMLFSFSYPSSLLQRQQQDDDDDDEDSNRRLESDLKLKINHRLDEIQSVPDWLKHVRCDIKREQVQLDRFAL
ncbi:uncharacterized protein BX663DRAFT_548395 [Cokeromyces recurvatus]|uniref:uncharacterized protein n=1 Tax=Cokeromyces recurvatus TaxID=90255 RepID=UPI00221E6F82|nr:uncharacterized protein BX663DRAFT_548395 [Cokeromyces recurvatus]KAI7907340.1 hypothetical protein BX663DRAFT_548395 [Cokeromyces recurvatus]